jgi:hypothetical protein
MRNQMIAEFRISAAKWVLGLLSVQEIEELATSAMVQGYDGPALRQLAASPAGSLRDIEDSVQSMFLELGVALQDRATSVTLIALKYAGLIADGTLPAYEGARFIWQKLAIEIRPHDHSLDDFIYWADEYENATDTKGRQFCERSIVQAAQQLLNAG